MGRAGNGCDCLLCFFSLPSSPLHTSHCLAHFYKMGQGTGLSWSGLNVKTAIAGKALPKGNLAFRKEQIRNERVKQETESQHTVLDHMLHLRNPVQEPAL